jgi:hypothetical protein
MTSGTNEFVLYTLAQVAITFAGFSGVVVAFRLRGAEAGLPPNCGLSGCYLAIAFSCSSSRCSRFRWLLRTGRLTLFGASATHYSVPGLSSVTCWRFGASEEIAHCVSELPSG